MNLENECASKQSQRFFELFFSMVTGSVGVFFVVIFIWFLNGAIRNHRMEVFSVVFLSIIFLIAYWFLKLTYKLAFNKCTYLLSVTELKITGWFFLLFPLCLLVSTFASGPTPSSIKELIPTLPGCFYGYLALKAANKRKTAIKQGNTHEPNPVRTEPKPF